MATSAFLNVAEKIRDQVAGFRALALVRLDGTVEECVIADDGFDRNVLSDFATLLRIADSTSVESGDGGLSEMSWRSDRSLILVARSLPDGFLVFFGGDAVPSGATRFLLRAEARRYAQDIAADALEV